MAVEVKYCYKKILSADFTTGPPPRVGCPQARALLLKLLMMLRARVIDEFCASKQLTRGDKS